MAKQVKVDLRKKLREIGNAIQDDNLTRLLTGETVSGGSVDPRKNREEAEKTRKRVRIHGIRTKLADLQGRPGVGSGAMLKDVTRRANVKVTRTSVKVIPSPDQRKKWFAFTAGTKHQPARSVSGISDDLLRKASEDLARESREQLVRSINEAKARGRST